MKEFMLYIRNEGDAKADLNTVEYLQFIKQCEVYIERLKSEKKLIAAQPLVREGFVISKNEEIWGKTILDIKKEIQVGYYHIIADNMDEAISIAKENPEFEFIPSATIEVRPVKMKELETNFIYPK
jgi:hypothetical protein